MSAAPGGDPNAGPAGKKRTDEGPTAAEFAGVGLQFAAAILVFTFLGQWLDRKLGTAPWLLIAGLFFGAGGGFYSMYRKLMAANAREDAARQARRDRDGGTR
jgi:ATP synthase protein I